MGHKLPLFAVQRVPAVVALLGGGEVGEQVVKLGHVQAAQGQKLARLLT